MLSPSPRNPLTYLYSRKQDEVYDQQADQHPLAQFPFTPNRDHVALYTVPVAPGHPSRKGSGSHLSAKSANRTDGVRDHAGTSSKTQTDPFLNNPEIGQQIVRQI